MRIKITEISLGLIYLKKRYPSQCDNFSYLVSSTGSLQYDPQLWTCHYGAPSIATDHERQRICCTSRAFVEVKEIKRGSRLQKRLPHTTPDVCGRSPRYSDSNKIGPAPKRPTPKRPAPQEAILAPKRPAPKRPFWPPKRSAFKRPAPQIPTLGDEL